MWHLVMTVAMCATWVVLAALTLVAFWRGEIFISAPETVLRDQLGLDEDGGAKIMDEEKGMVDEEKDALRVEVHSAEGSINEEMPEMAQRGRMSDERTVTNLEYDEQTAGGPHGQLQPGAIRQVSGTPTHY